MKIAGIAARTVFVLCIPLLLVSAVIAAAFNCVRLYEYGFDKYDVAGSTGLVRTELVKAAEGLISYFNSGDDLIYLTVEKNGERFELFTREEAIHFRDVKVLVRLDYFILVVTLVYVVAYSVVFNINQKHRRPLARSFLAGSGLTLLLVLVLWLGSMWNFDAFFYRFHLLVFTNDYWSAEGYMLLLFPGGFWYDVTVFCALGILAAALVMGGLSAGYLLSGGKGLFFRRLVS